MIGRTNCGAGGGLLSGSAILRVTAPTGSTVTLTRGAVVKTAFGHPSAGNVGSDEYFFILPAAELSATAWTVTATSGAKTDTQTVVIDAAKAYDVLMSYDFFLVRNGVLQNSVTIGSVTGNNVTAPTITDENGYKKIVLPTNSGVAFSEIDYTQFSTLYLEAEVTRKGNFSWIWTGLYSLATWVNDSAGGMVVYDHFSSWFPLCTIPFDLSNNPANYKIFKICTRATTSSGFDLNIYNVYAR